MNRLDRPGAQGGFFQTPPRVIEAITAYPVTSDQPFAEIEELFQSDVEYSFSLTVHLQMGVYIHDALPLAPNQAVRVISYRNADVNLYTFDVVINGDCEVMIIDLDQHPSC